MTKPGESIRMTPALVAGLYWVAFVMVALTILDYAGTVWPFQPGEANWRYGAAGLLSGFVLTPLLGLALAVMLAYQQQQATAMKIAGVVAMTFGILLIVTIVGFSLDAIQVRRAVAPEARRLTEMSAAKAVIKMLVAGVAAGWLGIGALRQPLPTAAGRRESAAVIVGS